MVVPPDEGVEGRGCGAGVEAVVVVVLVAVDDGAEDRLDDDATLAVAGEDVDVRAIGETVRVGT